MNTEQGMWKAAEKSGRVLKYYAQMSRISGKNHETPVTLRGILSKI
jgi:hypothetical protein